MEEINDGDGGGFEERGADCRRVSGGGENRRQRWRRRARLNGDDAALCNERK